MSKLHVLNTGRADCFILDINIGNSNKIVLIDGGTRTYNGKYVLNEFLLENSIYEIDLVIVTHLHQDHFGGFSSIDNRIKIKEAVLPVNALIFKDNVINFKVDENHFEEYVGFYNKLIQDKAKINLTFSKERLNEYLFGEYSLKCIYPINSEESVVCKCIEDMNNCEFESHNFNENFNKYKDNCNRESSIWTLEKNGKCEILFLGDSTLEISNDVIDKYNLKPKVLKLSHHGIGKQYYDFQQINKLMPNKIIITTDINYVYEFNKEFKKVDNRNNIQVIFSYKVKEFTYEF